MEMVKRFAIGAGAALLAFWALGLWHRHDTCRGWADFYADQARQLRAEAALPALGHKEAEERLAAAEIKDTVANKYAAVASRPWRPYPKGPLVTQEEMRLVVGKYKSK